MRTRLTIFFLAAVILGAELATPLFLPVAVARAQTTAAYSVSTDAEVTQVSRRHRRHRRYHRYHRNRSFRGRGFYYRHYAPRRYYRHRHHRSFRHAPRYYYRHRPKFHRFHRHRDFHHRDRRK